MLTTFTLQESTRNRCYPIPSLLQSWTLQQEDILPTYLSLLFFKKKNSHAPLDSSPKGLCAKQYKQLILQLFAAGAEMLEESLPVAIAATDQISVCQQSWPAGWLADSPESEVSQQPRRPREESSQTNQSMSSTQVSQAFVAKLVNILLEEDYILMNMSS